MRISGGCAMTGRHGRDLLAFAGRNGALILFVGVLIGLVAPTLADAARPLLGLAVFVFTLGAFLKVDLASFRKELARPAWTACMLAWTSLHAGLDDLRRAAGHAGDCASGPTEGRPRARDNAVHAGASCGQRGGDCGDAGPERLIVAVGDGGRDDFVAALPSPACELVCRLSAGYR